MDETVLCAIASATSSRSEMRRTHFHGKLFGAWLREFYPEKDVDLYLSYEMFCRNLLREQASRTPMSTIFLIYSFRLSRIVEVSAAHRCIQETRGQLEYEWTHFTRKVSIRNPAWYREHCHRTVPSAHPLFHITAGGVREWERLP